MNDILQNEDVYFSILEKLLTILASTLEDKTNSDSLYSKRSLELDSFTTTIKYLSADLIYCDFSAVMSVM